MLIQIEVTDKELEQYATILAISKTVCGNNTLSSGLLPLEKLAEKIVLAAIQAVKQETEHAQDASS